MKNLVLSLLTVFLISSGLFAQNDLPEIKLKNIEGEQINISDYAENGKITVFSFWATWCAPCKKELGNIAEIYEDWQDDYNTEVVAVSIDNQRNVPKVKSYVNGQGWEYDVILDTNQDLQRALNFQNVPYTLVVDQNGEISYRHSGYVDGDEYELEEHLEELTEAAEEAEEMDENEEGGKEE